MAAAFEPALRGGARSVEYHTAPNSDEEEDGNFRAQGCICYNAAIRLHLQFKTMDASTQTTFGELETSWAPGVFGMKYLTAAGITLLLYDGALNIGDEIRLVWLRPMDAMKLAFLITRYGTLGAMLLVAHVTSGLSSHSTEFCKGWVAVVWVSCSLSIAVTNIILVRRVYTLYDHRKIILRLLLFACVLTYIITLAFVILTSREMIAYITWEPILLRTCVLTSRPKFAVGFWTPQVVFELFTFVLTITNAAERPRRAQSRLVSELNRDGFVYIVMLFCLRTTNLVLSVLPAADLPYNWLFVFMSWSITLLTLSRLVLRVEAMRDRVGTMTLYVDELELTVQNEGCAQSAEGDSPPFITINTVTTTCII